VTYRLGNDAGQFGDRDVLAGADIDELGTRIGLHEMDAGICHVTDIEKFASRRAGAQTTTLVAPETFASWNRRINAATTWLYSRWAPAYHRSQLEDATRK
jgi:hypothetical protein